MLTMKNDNFKTIFEFPIFVGFCITSPYAPETSLHGAAVLREKVVIEIEREENEERNNCENRGPVHCIYCQLTLQTATDCNCSK